MPNQSHVKYVPAGTGPLYWGPGDRVTFLVTGAESGGACFITEVIAPPGGGPPLHIYDGSADAKMLLTISPAGPVGLQQFFEESFYPAPDRESAPPLLSEELVRRMMAAAPRNGLEFVAPD